MPLQQVVSIQTPVGTSSDSNYLTQSVPTSTKRCIESWCLFHWWTQRLVCPLFCSRNLRLMLSIVLLFCLTLLFLAVRRHSKGDEHMWHGPVTSCAWFNSYGNGVKRNNSGSSSILPITGGQRKYAGERVGPYANSRPAGRRVYSEKPLPSPKRQLPSPKRHPSGNSSLIGSHSSTNEFERGGMINPNRRWSICMYVCNYFVPLNPKPCTVKYIL